MAESEEERSKWWASRKTGFGALGAISPGYLVEDGVIPRSKLPDVLEKVKKSLRKLGINF
uniref:FAD-binding oxidoreductase/transferase type 4 C-terminal domain-containing protein n=1 Tax=Anaerobacillus isosaccharinicus TaxID=1532552 RepID=A0A1S2LL05_9BACI